MIRKKCIVCSYRTNEEQRWDLNPNPPSPPGGPQMRTLIVTTLRKGEEAWEELGMADVRGDL